MPSEFLPTKITDSAFLNYGYLATTVSYGKWIGNDLQINSWPP